jgi:two-component system, NarL family, nitrate/nitrite response regulator NarL
MKDGPTRSGLVIEDHDLMAEGILRAAADAGLSPLRRVASLSEAFALRAPDVVLLDLSLPGTCRLDTVAKVMKRWARTRILVLSADVDADYAVMLLRSGVFGVVSKDASIHYLKRLVQTAMSNRFALTRETASALLTNGTINPILVDILSLICEDIGFYEAAQDRGIDPEVASDLLKDLLAGSEIPVLTPAQLRVLVLVEAGLSNKAVALALDVRVKTIERHLRDIRQRMRLPDGEARQLGAFAQRLHRGCLLTIDEHLANDPELVSGPGQ